MNTPATPAATATTTRVWDARFDLSPADLVVYARWLPPSGADLVRAMGAEAAAKMIFRLPGVEFVVPKHRDWNAGGALRWAHLADVIGEEAMQALANQRGGSGLEVPMCTSLLAEKRNRWICAQFDDLTRPLPGTALSGRAALYRIGLELADVGRALTSRQIDRVLQSTAPADEHEARARQPSLFADLFPPALA